jgi:MraZ protein
VGRRLRFRGESRHKVDSKGRVSIPSSFRDVLRAGDPDCSTEKALPNFVMVYGIPNAQYIECFTIDEIERIEEGIEDMDYGHERDTLEEIYSSNAIPASVDNTGRIVIPAKLRDKFNIGAEAAMVASLNTFRIWDSEAYDAEKARRDAELKADVPANPLQWLNKPKGE